MSKLSVLSLILGQSMAATSGLKNSLWPRYEVTSYSGSLPAAATANGYTTANTGLYRCMRDGLVAIFP